MCLLLFSSAKKNEESDKRDRPPAGIVFILLYIYYIENAKITRKVGYQLSKSPEKWATNYRILSTFKYVIFSNSRGNCAPFSVAGINILLRPFLSLIFSRSALIPV